MYDMDRNSKSLWLLFWDTRRAIIFVSETSTASHLWLVNALALVRANELSAGFLLTRRLSQALRHFSRSPVAPTIPLWRTSRRPSVDRFVGLFFIYQSSRSRTQCSVQTVAGG